MHDETGGRSANVEADVLLLLRDSRSHRLALLEVKYDAGNPWYAAVENLLQVKLLSANREQRRLFHARQRVALLDEDLPVVGLVVAPLEYYRSPGQKSLAIQPAQRLHDRFRRELGVDLHLATWDAVARAVTPHRGRLTDRGRWERADRPDVRLHARESRGLTVTLGIKNKHNNPTDSIATRWHTHHTLANVDPPEEGISVGT